MTGEQIPDFLRHKKLCFGLTEEESGAWSAATAQQTNHWGSLLAHLISPAASGEWVGAFQTEDDTSPLAVWQTLEEYLTACRAPPHDFALPPTTAIYTVLPLSRWLQKESTCSRPLTRGFHHWVCMAHTWRGPKKEAILLFYGRVDHLTWDPGRIQWLSLHGVTPLMQYTAKHGSDMLREKHIIPNHVVKKWSGILLNAYRLRWKSVWIKQHASKEAGLLWLLWPRALAVNMWRWRVN